MTMLSRLRAKRIGSLATAIPAISATQPNGKAATVARIATVAVANPKEEKTAFLAKVGAGGMATTSRWWRLHFADRTSLEVSSVPSATQAEILASNPSAIAAEPFERPPGRQATPEEANELRQLVAQVCADYPDEEQAEALELALADADDALRCYRSLASRRTA